VLFFCTFSTGTTSTNGGLYVLYVRGLAAFPFKERLPLPFCLQEATLCKFNLHIMMDNSTNLQISVPAAGSTAIGIVRMPRMQHCSWHHSPLLVMWNKPPSNKWQNWLLEDLPTYWENTWSILPITHAQTGGGDKQ